MNLEDAIRMITEYLREAQPNVPLPTYGYDLYIPTAIAWDLQRRGTRLEGQALHDARTRDESVLCDAAWELARRGVIRPGVRAFNAQATADGSAGLGFSITPFGRGWVREAGHETFVPTEPGRFAQLLEPYEQRFGPGFYERAQEAIRCYGAHAYLGCCALAGASAESVILAAAVQKTHDEEQVLLAYQTGAGRGRIHARLTSNAPAGVKREFDTFLTLLKYWRDLAAHGRAVNIAENEAFTSLALLLRLAMFVNDNWAVLTA